MYKVIAFFFALFLIPATAFAEDYYWRPTSQITLRFSNIEDACSWVYTNYENNNSNRLVTERHHVFLSESSYQCQGKWEYPTGGGSATNTFNFGAVARYGDSCPVDSVYNPETGSCDEDENECEAKAGTSEPFSRSGVAPDEFMYISADGRFSIGAASGCFSGCAAGTIDKVCKTLTTGAYACRGNAEFTGEECGTGSDPGNGGPPIDPSDTPDTEPPVTTTDTTPCVYSTAPDGSQTCQSSSSNDKEGLNCGTVNGVAKCFDSQPSKNNIDVTTTVSDTANSDGTTTTTKTDTADVTRCVGTACKTTTTTTTTTTKRNPDGTVTQVTGECAGPDCPDENGNPDGDGDGFGDCIGTSCGDGGGGGGSYPGLEETPGFGESVSNFQQRLTGSPILSAVSSITVNTSGGSCSFPSVDTIIGPISFDAVCSYIDIMAPLYYVFLAGWAFVAIRLFMTA